MNAPLRTFDAELLRVEVHPDRDAAGRAMAAAVAASLRDLSARTPAAAIGVAFASAPSQDAFLEALVAQSGVPWERVTAFHLDEYLGLSPEHPSSFAGYLRRHLAERVPLGAFEPIRGDAPDAHAEALRYAGLLAATPLRIACLGIGENGHLAFNDPHAADPDDPEPVKTVSLDLASRRQQLHDGTFPRLEDVPERALTLTLPTLLGAGELHVVVPGARKAAAVRRTLLDPVGGACPATVLRRHRRARLYLDEAAAAEID